MSSKRHVRQHACGRKRRFETRSDAEAVLNRQAYHTQDTHLLVHECRWCGGYHIAHDTPGSSFTNGAKYAAQRGLV